MSDRLRIGVIGAGLMGELHARNLQRRLTSAELVAIADLDIALPEALASEIGGVEVHSDGHELIGDVRVNAVIHPTNDRTGNYQRLPCRPRPRRGVGSGGPCGRYGAGSPDLRHVAP